MFHTDGVPAAEATEDGGFPAPDKWNAPEFGTVTSDVLIIAGYTNSVKNKCLYKIKESQNCDSFIIRPSGGSQTGIFGLTTVKAHTIMEATYKSEKWEKYGNQYTPKGQATQAYGIAA